MENEPNENRVIVIGCGPIGFIHPFLGQNAINYEHIEPENHELNFGIDLSNILIDDEPLTRERFINLLNKTFGVGAENIREIILSLNEIASQNAIIEIEDLKNYLHKIEKKQNYENTNSNINRRFQKNEGKHFKTRPRYKIKPSSNYFKFVHHKGRREARGGGANNNR
jgi:hypothetical protein